MKIVSAFAAVVIFALGTTAVSSQQDPIAARKAIMKSNGQAAGALAKMIKGEAPFDLPTAKRHSHHFEDAAAKMPGLFPDNSKMGGETTASPKFGKTYRTSRPSSSSSATTPRLQVRR